MNKYFIALFFLLSQITSFAIEKHTRNNNQDTLHLTLTQVWHKAGEHSRHVEVKRLTERVSEEEIKDLKMERLPEIGLKATAEKASNMPIYENGLFSKPTQHEIIHTLYKVGTDMYLNLYNGNKLNLKIAEEKVLHHISTINREEAESDIRYNAASLYLDLQKSLIFKKLVIDDIADQEKQLLKIKSYYRNGTVLKSDVLRVELDLSRRKMLLVTIDNDILIATQKLNILIGEPDERIIMPVAFEINEKSTKTYDAFLAEAFDHSFAYHVSGEETELSKINLRQVKANIRPKFGIYGDFYYANPQIFLFPYNPYWHSLGVIGLKATVPVSALYHNIHKVKAAKLELEKEEEAHKDTEDRVRQKVKEAYLRYKESLVQIQVAEVNMAHAEENARIIKNTYFSHTSLITDLLDADIQLLQTRFELAAARILAQDKYYLLQNITGVL